MAETCAGVKTTKTAFCPTAFCPTAITMLGPNPQSIALIKND